MSSSFALIVDPAPFDDPRADFSGTFERIDPSAPALSVGELSTQRGDGVFESIGVVDGHPQEVGAHLKRLAHSAELCDLPTPNEEQWRQAIALASSSFSAAAPVVAPAALAVAADPSAAVAAVGASSVVVSADASAARAAEASVSAAPVAPASARAREGVIKLILSRGVEHGPTPTAWVTAAPAADFTAARTRGIRVVLLDRGIDSAAPQRAPWLLMGAKTLSYAVNMAAIREAKRRGADDAIFVSSDGVVWEAPTASVILQFGDRIVTPAPSSGILHGTTQLSLFDHLRAAGRDVGYATFKVAELADADAAWLVSSVRLAAPITAIDAHELRLDHGLTDSFNRYLLTPRD